MVMRLFGKPKPELNADSRVSCTERGRMEARKYATNRFEYEVLGVIADRGSPTISEIAEETGKSVDDVKKAIANRLRGLVTVIGGGNGFDDS